MCQSGQAFVLASAIACRRRCPCPASGPGVGPGSTGTAGEMRLGAPRLLPGGEDELAGQPPASWVSSPPVGSAALTGYQRYRRIGESARVCPAPFRAHRRREGGGDLQGGDRLEDLAWHPGSGAEECAEPVVVVAQMLNWRSSDAPAAS